MSQSYFSKFENADFNRQPNRLSRERLATMNDMIASSRMYVEHIEPYPNRPYGDFVRLYLPKECELCGGRVLYYEIDHKGETTLCLDDLHCMKCGTCYKRRDC